MSGAGGFDVYIADQVWLPEFFEKGFIRDLSSLYTDADRSAFLEDRARNGDLQGRPRRSPDHGAQLRHVLPHRPHFRAAQDLGRVPCARQGRRRRDVFGTMVCSKQGIEAATRLHSFYQQAGGDLLADGAPTINSDAGRAALEFMVALVSDGSAPEGVLELPDMQGRWLEGKLAMAPVWPYLYSLSKEPLGDRFSIATAPGLANPGGTVYSWGFAGATGARESRWCRRVPEVGNQHRYALRLRQGMVESGAARVGRSPRSRPMPRSATPTRLRLRRSPASAAAGKSMTMVPQYSQLLDILGIMQSGVMSKAMTIDQALADGQSRARRRWRPLIPGALRTFC